ncbi:MAG: hypothetical protein ACI9SJ_001338 [Flavobacteriaceae bacterium]|jgi:hypothetical protein|uniref:hypothetical protein n=1 Tax=Candidatus Marifrigoribacter sp. Uisw_064 TaxID=3230970 RepID=UPI003AE3461A
MKNLTNKSTNSTCSKIAFFIFFIFFTAQTFAQEESSDLKYRRSSLYTLMIADENREFSSVIQETFTNSTIPDKFNNHIVTDREIPKTYNDSLSKKELKIAQEEAIVDYFSTNDIAKGIVAKWFNRSESGGFNMNLIAERGSYNATDLDIKIAKNSERGLSMVADAGEELIKNTFVVVNDFKYTNKEEVAKKTKGLLSVVSAVGGSTVSLIADGTSAAVGVLGKGYIIKTSAYLYKLVWNEEVAAIFYNDFWTDDSSIDAEKVKAFNETDLFTLEVVGVETAWADLQSTTFTKKSEEELISVATIKAVDAVIAKLQRKYEVFRTKTPLKSGDPISAAIGLKEGLEKGDKYEVLEQVINDEGKTVYERLGVIKVEKGKIWDNRYLAEEENPSENKFTIFKGKKNKYYSGMLIRQID